MITILDGGMGGELIKRGLAAPTGIWSAQALVDAPRAVVTTHLDYIEAGADIITTNTYSTIPSYLAKAGMQDKYVELTALAGMLAREAADTSPRDALVAGGLPPLSESYRPDLVPGDAEARPVYLAMAQALEPYVDLFLCETMSSIAESRNAASQTVDIARKRDLPVYVSWTLNEIPGSGLRSGESVEAAIEALADLDIAGYLFNCTHPEAIEAGLAILAGLTDKPIGGYPNRMTVPDGWTLDNEINVTRRDFGTAAFVNSAERCIAAGATLFGGCCGVGPEDIAALARALASP